MKTVDFSKIIFNKLTHWTDNINNSYNYAIAATTS